MALKLYSLTPNHDKYQEIGFSVMLISTTVIVTIISISMTLENTKKCCKCFLLLKNKIIPRVDLDSHRSKDLTFERKIDVTVSNSEQAASSPYKIEKDLEVTKFSEND